MLLYTSLSTNQVLFDIDGVLIATRVIEGEFPNKGLKYPKTREKPRFHTWDEITDKINAGELTDEEQKDLWDCLFLSNDEIAELLLRVLLRAIVPQTASGRLDLKHALIDFQSLSRTRADDLERGFVNS